MIDTILTWVLAGALLCLGITTALSTYAARSWGQQVEEMRQRVKDLQLEATRLQRLLDASEEHEADYRVPSDATATVVLPQDTVIRSLGHYRTLNRIERT